MQNKRPKMMDVLMVVVLILLNIFVIYSIKKDGFRGYGPSITTKQQANQYFDSLGK